MAAWQFPFYLAPNDAVTRHYGPNRLILDCYRFDDWDDDTEYPNLWEGRSPKSYAQAIKELLPPRKSWSDEALMFGDEEGDDVTLWDDEFRIRLNVNDLNASLMHSFMTLAAQEYLTPVIAGTGRVITSSFHKLSREISNSHASRFVKDPKEALMSLVDQMED